MSDDTLRTVTLRRTKSGRFVAINQRGVELPLGTGEDVFTPVELLLAGIAGCTGLDVDTLTSRRAEAESFEIEARAHKIKDEGGNRLTDIEVIFRVRFPEGDTGDHAREMLPDLVKRSHDRWCTVSRTVELGTQVTTRIE
jgi:putative redox protein